MTSAMPVQCSNRAIKSHSGEQVNLLGSCFPVKGMSYERNVITYSSPLCDFIARLEHCTGVAEVMGSNPVESPELFRFMRQF